MEGGGWVRNVFARIRDKYDRTDSNLTLTASLLISPIHAIPVPITHIAGVYAAVVWTLELPWVARASQLCHRQFSMLTE